MSGTNDCGDFRLEDSVVIKDSHPLYAGLSGNITKILLVPPQVEVRFKTKNGRTRWEMFECSEVEKP